MKSNIQIWILLSTLSAFSACNLEKIEEEPGGNATKFNTSIGGSAYDSPSDILCNTDGSYVVVGYSKSATAPADEQAYIAKLNKQGTIVWEKTIGGAKDEHATAVTNSSDGGYVFCGFAEVSDMNKDITVTKVDAQGNVVWNKTFTSTDTLDMPFGIIPTSNGEFIIGYYQTLPSTRTIKLLRINANGVKIGQKLVRTGSFSMAKMIKTTDNKIAMAGIDFTAGTAAYILKINEDGTFIWENKYPTQAANFTIGYNLVEMADKSLVLAGSDLGSNDHDFTLVAYNEIGGFLWSKTWGGANADELLGIARSSDNELVVMGYTSSFSGFNEFYLSKRKAIDGSMIWEKHFLTTGVSLMDIERCPDGGFILCAGQNQANADIIIVKTDASGNYQ